MNDLIFLNHMSLLGMDQTIGSLEKYSDYFSIYKRFPSPPGIEYISGRSSPIDVVAPWRFQSTQYPIPSLPKSTVTFTDAADSFGIDIVNAMDSGIDVYLFWSGGIDSTSVAVSILKYIKPAHVDKFYVILTDASCQENPFFYRKFLKQYNQINFHNFDAVNYNLTNTIILDGEGGDQIFGSATSNYIFGIHPHLISQPWRQNIDFLKKQWYSIEIPTFWDLFLNMMTTSIANSHIQVETLYDFYWWLNFNFKYDSVMLRHTLNTSRSIPDSEFQYFVQTVMKRMYGTELMQQWSMTAPNSEKMGNGGKHVKFAGKKYIYEFDKNEYYLREKRKEYSLPTVGPAYKHFFAIDKNYQRYSLSDREIRKQLRELFYPDTIGRIKFKCEKRQTSRIWTTS